MDHNLKHKHYKLHRHLHRHKKLNNNEDINDRFKSRDEHYFLNHQDEHEALAFFHGGDLNDESYDTNDYVNHDNHNHNDMNNHNDDNTNKHDKHHHQEDDDDHRDRHPSNQNTTSREHNMARAAAEVGGGVASVAAVAYAASKVAKSDVMSGNNPNEVEMTGGEIDNVGADEDGMMRVYGNDERSFSEILDDAAEEQLGSGLEPIGEHEGPWESMNAGEADRGIEMQELGAEEGGEFIFSNDPEDNEPYEPMENKEIEMQDLAKGEEAAEAAEATEAAEAGEALSTLDTAVAAGEAVGDAGVLAEIAEVAAVVLLSPFGL
jgi:hypothetical protein